MYVCCMHDIWNDDKIHSTALAIFNSSQVCTVSVLFQTLPYLQLYLCATITHCSRKNKLRVAQACCTNMTPANEHKCEYDFSIVIAWCSTLAKAHRQ